MIELINYWSIGPHWTPLAPIGPHWTPVGSIGSHWRLFRLWLGEKRRIGDEIEDPVGPKGEWKWGLCPRTPVFVGLKASEMSAFGPPQGCAFGSLWELIIH